jgi:predicted NBD/HSP70 family sugar kinase
MTHKPARSPRLMRQLNLALVLQTIRAKGPVSRVDIAKETGLSKPTVNEVVDHLLSAGYVQETIANDQIHAHRPGPRPRLLTFRADLGYVLGIDIGADKLLAMVADLSGAIVATERCKTERYAQLGAEQVLREVRVVADTALTKASIPRSRLKAVGVGTPGVVDPVSGRVTLAPQLAGWEGITLGKRLQRHFPCPVLVDNEVHLAVLAERWRGAAQGIDDVVYIGIGIGIGAGIIIGGELYRGADGAAGEIGYLPVVAEEAEPPHGFGWFEYAAGGGAFARLGRRRAAEPGGETLRTLAGGDPEAVSAQIIFAAAQQGDAAACELVAELVERLARGVAAVCVVLNPALVIIGGGLSRAGEMLLTPLTQRVAALVPVAPRIVLSTLGDEAVALGGIGLALQEVDKGLFDFGVLEAAS